MEAAVLEAIGKLSVEVVAILTLSLGYFKMSKSIDKLVNAIKNKEKIDLHHSKNMNIAIKKAHKDILEHRREIKKFEVLLTQ